MRFCEAPNCNNPVFSTCKISGKGYCRNHQYMKDSFDRRSILQRGIDKHKEQQKTKQRKPGWFDETVLEGKITKAGFTPDNQLEKIIEYKKGNILQWRWFNKQRNAMTGVCAHCGGKTQKYDDDTFHYSIAHLLPKSLFKSVATNDLNWIELCYYGNSCHTNLDNHMIDITELNCFSQVIDKFVAMYPFIDKSERRRIPEVLLQYLEVEK